MNKFLRIQLKLNTFNFLKLSLITLAILLSFGTHTRANAESESEVEVISIPPQEAYYTEDKNHRSSSSDRSQLENENTSGNNNMYVPDSVEDSQNANIVNSSPSTRDMTVDRRFSS
ncbi:hypothetical protein F7734_15250 [Scytonema sp. UIC 10036]|uniref:hypothetical protein n=1 Tax=Scytonema sp. UIC 10036 TaxID=2304196 RepID=UPI0012DAB1D8|nr:hypothetical protein [Scytonema sp. UIC 10036]MUG93702.1 hypothetical protein [Scytonema sp. UIC 10036]